jgi:PKD repeat protein
LLESRELLDSTPLNDLGTGLYQGYVGGLYLNGSNQPPAATRTFALNRAQQVAPLDANGAVDPAHGRIVMISVGVSNTMEEFSQLPTSFKELADADKSKNPQLVIVNGAQGGQDAPQWLDPNATTWNVVDQNLANSGLTPAQVEIAWVKLPIKYPYKIGGFPISAQVLQSDLETVARNLLIRYPNIKIAYFSSRTHAYTTSLASANPEPWAYEMGFSVQWMMQDQINGNGNLNDDPTKGTVVAPLILWGPYLWATNTPRSDGFTWLPTDVTADLIHPSPTGIAKVGQELLAFFKTDPTATPWFLKPTPAGQGPVVTASANVTSGNAGMTVQFTASATDPNPITQYAWTFDDGDFSMSQNPTKSFPDPGTFQVHLTVTDSLGNTTQQQITITVGGTGGGGGSGGGGGGGGSGQSIQTTDNTNFLFHVFPDLLGRTPTDAELSSWLAQLNNVSITRGQLALDLMAGQEYENLVVSDFYANILRRPTDPAGQAAWVSFLSQGGTQIGVQAGLLGSGEFFTNEGGGTNSSFLNVLYQYALNRPIDMAGLQAWIQALQAGMSRTDVVTAVLNSPESDTDQVQALYQRFLGRAADPTGLQTFVTALEQGTPYTQVIADLIASPEYSPYPTDPNQVYVGQLYKDLLNRSADAAGLAFFTGELDNGTATRQHVVQAILSSGEYHTDVVQALYTELLHRSADPAGLSALTTLFAQGGTDEQVAATLAGSGEYFTNRGGGTNDGFLTALYQDALGRAVDAAGRAAWDQALAAGTTPPQVASAIFASTEYDQDLVQKFYTKYLGRSADPTGLTNFVNGLQTGMHDEDVILSIVTSGEYFVRAQP